jgi:hypothetical protein
MDHLIIAQLLGNYGEFIGAIAVVVTLVYLAAQIRENTKATQADSQYAVGQMTLNLCLAISNDGEFANIWRRGLKDLSTLDADELFRWNQHAYAVWDSYEINFLQWRRGALSDGDWVKWQRVIKNYKTQPGMQEYWQEAKNAFHPDSQEIVDKLEPELIGITGWPS